MKLNTNGAVEWSQHLNTSADETPTHIAVDADGHILVSEIVGTVYQTVRYSEYVPNNAVIRDSANRAVAMQYQVIVRFNENAVNRDAVDGNIGSAESVFGDLEYFLQPNAAQAVRTKLSGQCNTITSINNACPLKLSKVFPLLRTTDTTTISRMGEVIPIPTFWATFVLHLPEGANLQRAMDSLNTLFPTVFFCHANQIGYPTSVPNDHFYNTGGLADLRPTSLYPNGHVNVEPAWDIETGKEHVKVGVFDTGLQWQHEDFGYDGVNPNSSRVVDGWDFDRNSFLKLLPHVEGLNHGTPVAGIIGAVRNNNIGIPGIAGGDAQVGKKGVSLYGLKIYDSGGTDNNLPMSTIANAIVTSTIEPNRIRFRPYSYGLHIMNHSWLVGGVRPGSTPISPTNVKLLEDAVHFVNRAKVTFVNCRGNEGRDDVGDRAYPALFNDDWLICVGGTGTNGLYSTSALPNRNSSNTSSYGKTVDIAGPTSELLIDGALREGGTARNIYSNFLGTSAATPHAAGAAALLMSYLNEPVPDYKNLAPEDVEEILQKSATDVGDEGRDDYTGFGRLNIGRALQSVRKPCWQLNHYGTSTTAFSNQITQFPSQIATLSQNYTNNDGIVFAANQPYEVVPIKIEATMNHNLPITADIHAFWARSSSSNLLKALEPQVGGLPSKLEPIEKVVIKPNTVNRNQLRIEGYIYEVRDMSNNFIGWIPKDLRPVNSFQLEYTLLIRDNRFCQDRVTTQDVITIENVTLYPNPTQGLQTLRINLAVSTQLSITLCDVTGKVLKQVFNGESTNGENDYACDFKDLPNGFYVYRIQTNEVVRYVKTVKN
jgi:subtilisin family serine protease